MKTGKLSESVLKRSVLGKIKKRRAEVIKGAGIGEDCAFLTLEKSRRPEEEAASVDIAVSMETVVLPVKNAAYLAVMAAVNNLAAGGGVPVAVVLSVTLPTETEEGQLKGLIGEAERCCRDLNIQIVGGHTEVSPWVKVPVVTASVTGKAAEAKKALEAFRRQQSYCKKKGNQKLDIVMSKWIGLEGTFILAEEKEKELLKRYPAGLVNSAKELERWLSVGAEAEVALKRGVYAMHDIRNGGVFGALWELSLKVGLGFCVDLKKIPVKQETIEVCEFFGINPYELLSGGALLMLTEDGDGLVRALADGGIPSAVIGQADTGNDKIVRNGEEVRYLGPSPQDEIFKVMPEKAAL